MWRSARDPARASEASHLELACCSQPAGRPASQPGWSPCIYGRPAGRLTSSLLALELTMLVHFSRCTFRSMKSCCSPDWLRAPYLQAVPAGRPGIGSRRARPPWGLASATYPLSFNTQLPGARQPSQAGCAPPHAAWVQHPSAEAAAPLAPCPPREHKRAAGRRPAKAAARPWVQHPSAEAAAPLAPCPPREHKRAAGRQPAKAAARPQGSSRTAQVGQPRKAAARPWGSSPAAQRVEQPGPARCAALILTSARARAWRHPRGAGVRGRRAALPQGRHSRLR